MQKEPSEILREDVERARANYEKAKTHLALIRAKAGSDGPGDEMDITRESVRVHVEAIIAYTKALHRFNDFLLRGTVPAEFRPSSRD